MAFIDMLKKIPGQVKLMEVAPRDGLQNEIALVGTPQKISFINDLVKAGIKRIEVTAFVSPRWIPPLADQMEVALGIKKVAGVSYAALVPNIKGYERARSANVDEVSIVVAVSDTHNRKNLNGDTKKVMERYHELAKRARQDSCPFRAYLSCAFGCPYEGKVDLASVADLAQELLDMGAYEIALSDTIGIASPIDTAQTINHVKSVIPLPQLALHMHDTRGTGLANILAGLLMGVASFDSSAGGLGGCPYAPGASGNVATEDLVFMLSSMGIDTGIDISRLCQASIKMEKILKKHVPSKLVAIHRARKS